MGFPIYGTSPASGSLDTSFEQGSGFNKQAVKIYEKDDEYYITGDNGGQCFNVYNGVSSQESNQINPFMRLDKNTFLPDKMFKSKSSFDIKSLFAGRNCIMTDGTKVYLFGTFNTYQGQTTKNIAVLNDVDMSLSLGNTGTGFSTSLVRFYGLLGNYIIASDLFAFTYNGGPSSRVHVIDKTTLIEDTTLTNFLNPNGQITTGIQQSDGKYILVGNFTSIAGISINRIVRFNSDWTLDTTFNTNVGTGAGSLVNDVKLLSDGKIVLGGVFTTFNGTTTQRIVVLNTDGTIASSVASGFNSNINNIDIDGSDNIYCFGIFDTYGVDTRNRVCKLSSTLTLDATFNPNCNNAVNKGIIVGNNIYMVGNFTLVGATTANRIVVVDKTSGAITSTLGLGFISASAGPTGITQSTNNVYFQTDSNTYNGLSGFDGEFTKGVSQLDKKGKLIKSYDGITNGDVVAAKNIVRDGTTMYISGGTNNYYGFLTSIAKFNNYVFDTTYLTGTIGNLIRGMIFDGGPIIVGDFTSPNNRIVKYNTAGTIDATFNVGTGFNNQVNAILKHSSGNYIVMGNFTTYKGVTQNRLIMLDNVGSKVATFDVGTGLAIGDTTSGGLLELSNGNILVYGNITSYKGVACEDAIILDVLGNKVSFINQNHNGNINHAVEHNGKIYMVGAFTTFGATTVNRIMCVDLATGTLVNIFGTGLNGTGNGIIVDSEGKLVVVGNFTTYNGQPVGNVARIFI